MAKGESPLKQFEIQPLVELNLFGQIFPLLTHPYG